MAARERGRPGGELEVYAPEEGVKLELKARAENDRGVSAWSKPLRVRTRHKAVEGGCDAGAFKWTQTRADVTLHMPVSPPPWSQHSAHGAACDVSAAGGSRRAPGCPGRARKDQFNACAQPAVLDGNRGQLRLQVPRRVAGRDLRVSLKDGQLHISVSGELHITVSEQGLSAVWVEGTLRNPAKGFGDGSVWELVREGDGKVCRILAAMDPPPCSSVGLVSLGTTVPFTSTMHIHTRLAQKGRLLLADDLQ